MSDQLQPFFADVQAHYDLSDEFYQLFLDPTRTYSCAYFREPEMSLEEAQLAKVELSLGKCDLQAGQTLLDIGCGWGTTALRAAQDHKVNVIGLTLSQNQQKFASARHVPKDTQIEFRLQGWEQFADSVDRIISIGAFEHFRFERHEAFFSKCRRLLPADGTMLLHTIVLSSYQNLKKLRIEIGPEDVAFAKFIRSEIFPGGQLCPPERIEDFTREAGFTVAHTESLGPHYARTLDCWSENLKARQDEAVCLTSNEVYERYMKYLTGCADFFRKGNIDVMQFRLACA
ncbi:MAG: class I SAM-dependent methyltransferase [Pirellulaceae bacterium]